MKLVKLHQFVVHVLSRWRGRRDFVGVLLERVNRANGKFTGLGLDVGRRMHQGIIGVMKISGIGNVRHLGRTMLLLAVAQAGLKPIILAAVQLDICERYRQNCNFINPIKFCTYKL